MTTTAVRWWKFNAVGAGGIVVQLLMLAFLKSGLHVNYLAATALAVESAVVHNFFWHERFTWADRAGSSFPRFVKFNLTNGALSLLGNVVLMKVLVEVCQLPYLVANGASIAGCATANFLLSDRFVFRGGGLRGVVKAPANYSLAAVAGGVHRKP